MKGLVGILVVVLALWEATASITYLDDRPKPPRTIGNLLKKQEKMTLIFYETADNRSYEEDIIFQTSLPPPSPPSPPSSSLSPHRLHHRHLSPPPPSPFFPSVPLSLLWRHCFVRHPVDRKLNALTHEKSDNHTSEWNRQFAYNNPISAEDVLQSKLWGPYPPGHGNTRFKEWKKTFEKEFHHDPTTLDLHDYTPSSPHANVSLKLMYEHCFDSSLPFFFPWLMVDEADVVLIFPPDPLTIRQRIEENCPLPPRRGGRGREEERACLVFVRCGQFLLKEREWVAEELLKVFQERGQKFVLVSAWQEIWCTPFGTYPPNTRRRENLSPSMYEKITNILDSPLLIAWWGKNICVNHPKLRALPLGAKREPNGIYTWERMFKTHLWYFLGGHRAMELFEGRGRGKGEGEKETLLAKPLFEITNTDAPARDDYRMLRRVMMKHLEKEFGKEYVEEVKNLTERGHWPNVKKHDAITYFEDIRKAKFCLSPTGAAIDSHRAWETLLLGGIPIVHDTTLNSLFDDLPVFILRNQSLENLNEASLNRLYRKLHAPSMSRQYKWEKLYGFYWLIEVRKSTIVR